MVVNATAVLTSEFNQISQSGTGKLNNAWLLVERERRGEARRGEERRGEERREEERRGEEQYRQASRHETIIPSTQW